MTHKIGEDENFINYWFEDKEDVFGWFLNRYSGGEADGKLVVMDNTMLIKLLNSNSCKVVSMQTTPTPNNDAYDQRIVLCWDKQNFPLAFATINLHGQNSVVKDNERYRMATDAQDWVVFSHVDFEPDTKNKYDEEFSYANNMAEDKQIVCLSYAPENYLEKVLLPKREKSKRGRRGFDLGRAISEFAREHFKIEEEQGRGM